MEELYRTIEETIKTSGCPFPADGEEIYNEICDEIENREPGAYVFFSKKTDDTFFEYRLQIFEDNFNISSIDIHIADKNYHVDFD